MSKKMQRTVKVENLELGMYVILNVPWYRHPFVKGEFLLKDEDQIQKLLETDITEVIVDPEKSIVIEKNRPSARIHQHDNEPSLRTHLPDKSRSAIRGEKLPVREKQKDFTKPSEEHRKPSLHSEGAVKPLSSTAVSEEPGEAIPNPTSTVRERMMAMQKYSEEHRKPSSNPEGIAKPVLSTVVAEKPREATHDARAPVRESMRAMQTPSEDQRKPPPRPEGIAKPVLSTVVAEEPREATHDVRVPVRESMRAMQTPSEDQQKPSPHPERTAPSLSVSVVPDELREAIHDAKLSPQVKAKAVQKHTAKMLINLMDNPNAENIQDVKKSIAEVVDLILSDDATAFYLLSITSHDFCTYTHSVNVGLLGVSLSKVLFKRSTAHNMHELGSGFFLHDLGKVHIDNSIINKPGKLTDEEMEQMRRHPDLGHKILMETNQLTDECKKIVMQHHERFDGLGYPQKLKGEDIHLYGRICSIADVYEALTSDRPYRKKMHPFVALTVMKDEMIEHFHKDLFEKFVLLFTKA